MKMLFKYAYQLIVLLVLFILFVLLPNANRGKASAAPFIPSKDYTTIHIITALCDNKYQGIVKVPESIGNGQSPETNLYWGAAYGIKAFFSRKQSDWKLVHLQKNVSDTILERLIFRHKTKPVFLMADAYDGRYIKKATEDLLEYASGNNGINAIINDIPVSFGGSSDIICYTGHDGLMDFAINRPFNAKSNKQRNAIILACYSKRFFSPHLKNTGAAPLVWTTGLMAPEAYILHDALEARLNNESGDMIRDAAAKAYSKHQKCSMNAAQKLLVTGW